MTESTFILGKPKLLSLGIKAVLFVLIMLGGIIPSVSADELTLRNLKTLTGIKAEKISFDGVQLSDGRLVTFDAILSGKFESQQTEFEQVLSSIGDPLFRIRVRMGRQDFENLAGPLQKIYSTFENRSGRSAVLVHTAQFRSSLSQGQRSLALRSYFHLHRLLQNEKLKVFASSLGLKIESGFHPDLAPLGYDRETLATHWDSIVKAYQGLPENASESLVFYFRSMSRVSELAVPSALQARGLQLSPREKQLLDVLTLLQQGKKIDETLTALDLPETEEGFGSVNPLEKRERALWTFAIGWNETTKPERSGNGMLKLLKVHAKWGQEFPDLAAAALFQTWAQMQNQEMKIEANQVRRELFFRYPSSISANRLRIKMAKR